MCICRQPDRRSDHALLKIPLSIDSYIDHNHEQDLHGRVYMHHNNSFLASEHYSNSSQNDFTWKRQINWETLTRVVMVLLLTFTSITFYKTEKEMALQRVELEHSMKKIKELNYKLEQSKAIKMVKINSDVLLEKDLGFGLFH